MGRKRETAFPDIVRVSFRGRQMLDFEVSSRHFRYA